MNGMDTKSKLNRWRPYSSYKESGVEWFDKIPASWMVHKLKHVAKVTCSNVDKLSSEGERPVRLCNYVDVYHNDYITPALELMNATATKVEIGKFSLRQGDVLITKDSEEWNDIAVSAFVPATLPDVLCGYHLAQIRTIPTVMDGRYLFRAFSASGVNDQFRVMANGITRYGIGIDSIDNSRFLVPPLNEQSLIAAFLDHETAKIDAVISKKERLIEILEEKRSALISHAVTKGLSPNVPMKDSGIEWLGKIPAHWEIKKIKHLASIVRGKFTHRPRNDPRMYDGPYPFIQTGDIASAQKYVKEFTQTLNEEGFSVSKQFPKGTLVMTIAANIGDMAILDFEACFPDSIVGFVPTSENCLNFLYHLFTAMKPELLSTAVLNTQLNLNIDRIGALWTLRPPPDEQNAIADFLDSQIKIFESIISKANCQIERLREFRTAVISAAVTGKIDVREIAQ